MLGRFSVTHLGIKQSSMEETKLPLSIVQISKNSEAEVSIILRVLKIEKYFPNDDFPAPFEPVIIYSWGILLD